MRIEAGDNFDLKNLIGRRREKNVKKLEDDEESLFPGRL